MTQFKTNNELLFIHSFHEYLMQVYCIFWIQRCLYIHINEIVIL